MRFPPKVLELLWRDENGPARVREEVITR